MTASIRTLLGRLPVLFKRMALTVFLCICVLIFLAVTVGDRTKSYSAHAQTRGIDIVFNEHPVSGWRLEDVLVCFRAGTPALAVEGGEAATTPLCDPDYYQVERFRNVEFIWPPKTHLQIARVGIATPLEIDVLEAGNTPLLFGGIALPARSRLIVSPTSWADAGTLPLEGQITIGDTPSSGSQLNLIQGNYAVSERLSWYNQPVEVVSGNLRSGDVVRMLDSADAGNAFGFIEPAGKDEAGFLVTLFSALGDSQFKLFRYGVIDLKIEPSFIDRALRNPALLALGVLLAILGGSASALQLARWIWVDDQKHAGRIQTTNPKYARLIRPVTRRFRRVARRDRSRPRHPPQGR